MKRQLEERSKPVTKKSRLPVVLFPLLDLPQDLVLLCCSFLDPPSRYAAAFTCTLMNKAKEGELSKVCSVLGWTD